MKSENKTQATEKISEFFKLKHDKEKVKKIKRLAMSHQIKLKNLRKKFCSKCFSMNLRVLGVKKNVKRVECGNCGGIIRWKVK